MEEKKKKIYQKWWFWLLIVIIFIAIIGSSDTSNNTVPTQSNVFQIDSTNASNENSLDGISESVSNEVVAQNIPSDTNPTSSITLGQKNALSKAKDYLKMTAFSYKGLIEQLEFEGFSTEESTYGADNCNADWNEQAAKKAKDYLNMMSFSRSSLIEQLEFEGFTSEQAEYGATAVGY